jgi:hypothetical protein
MNRIAAKLAVLAVLIIAWYIPANQSNAVQPAPGNLGGDDVIQLLSDTVDWYGKVEMYADSGTYTSLNSRNGRAAVESFSFKTLFVRGERFYMLIKPTTEEHGAFALIPKSYELEVDLQRLNAVLSTLENNVVTEHEEFEKISTALAAVSGHTGISAHRIPSLLGLVDHAGLDLLDRGFLLCTSPDTIDGNDCALLTGIGAGNIRSLIWIDTTTHVIRRVIETDHDADGSGIPRTRIWTYQRDR